MMTLTLRRPEQLCLPANPEQASKGCYRASISFEWVQVFLCRTAVELQDVCRATNAPFYYSSAVSWVLLSG